METIKTTAASAATAVTNIVWGSNGNTTQEPQSGVQGDTSKGEPFDGGNMDPPKTPQTESGPPETAGGASSKQDSSVEKGDSTKAQNDVRDPSNPRTDEKKAEAAKNVDDSGEGPNSVKVDGPGPKPIEQVAREHGGDAGNLGKDGKDVKEANEGAAAAAAGTKSDTAPDDDDGPQKVSHGEGTGELYVKSSGLHADGGDFDATKPGAGKEADRLLEKKGIHHAGNSIEKSPSADSKGSSPEREGKKKRSLGQKIKDKLHRNSNSGS